MLRTLIIDDSLVFLEALSELLGRFPGVSVAGMASSGEDGLREAEQLAPDIAFVDLNMPDMGGLEVAKELRKKQPHIRVVIISLHDDEEYRASAAAIGVERFICKKELLTGLLHIFGHVPSDKKLSGAS